VHSLRPNPKNNIQEGWRTLDFLAHHPESCHMVHMPCMPDVTHCLGDVRHICPMISSCTTLGSVKRRVPHLAPHAGRQEMPHVTCAARSFVVGYPSRKAAPQRERNFACSGHGCASWHLPARHILLFPRAKSSAC
jgi:hypothetical protein